MRPRRLFLIAYLASGAAGLLYEVAWARLLTLYLGHSTAAVSTVLAAFMGGLAAGAAAGGRYAPRLNGPKALRTYAALEIAIGACALLLPAALGAAQPLLVWAYDPVLAGGFFYALTRVAACLVIIAVPAALMGATFPLAVRWYVRSAARAGRDTGTLYAANTVGAAAGAAFTGFVLLPQLGLRATTIVGVVLNGAAAAIAWWAAGAAREEEALGTTPSRPGPRKPARRAPGAAVPVIVPRPWIATAAIALSGFVALTYEVTWTRLLALIIGPTTYAFALMLAAFIAGLALGSAVGARWADRRDPLPSLALALVVTGLGGLLVAATASDLPLRVANMVARPDATFFSVIRVEATTLVALLLPTTFALGAAFPLAVAAATGPGRAVARDAAVVYAGNTLGAIAGSLASGFFLVSRLGLRATIITIALAAAAGGVVVVLTGRASSWMRLTVVALTSVVIAGAAVLPGWNRALLSSGAYKYAPYLRGADLETALEAGTLLYYAEGPTGTVSVRRSAGTLALAIDGKVDASNGGDMLTQKLLGHLPLLLHPAPARVGVVGLGSGVTLGAVLRHPVAHADVIEISPEVVRASAFFVKENLDALEDPRTRLILGDARTHLTLGRDRYDVIISEPSNPWMAGVASLFTREFFDTLRTRLAPGGIVCQWAHTYDISGADLRSIVATFLAVFPKGALWLIGDGDVLLIAGDEPIETLLSRMERSWQRPGVAADLAVVAVKSPFELLSQLVAAGSTLAEFASGGVVQTDDRMALEFSAPKGIVGPTRLDNAATLRELAAGSAPELVRRAQEAATITDWKQRGLMLLQAEAPREAYTDLARAAALDPGDREALSALEQAAAAAHRVEDALALLKQLDQDPRGRTTARVAAARILASLERIDEALRVVDEGLSFDPNDVDLLTQQASVFADMGDLVRLEAVLRRLEDEAPDRPDTVYFMATAALMGSRVDEAARLAERVVTVDPRHARAQNLLGAAQANLGNVGAARRAFKTSAELNPRDATAYANLGALELLQAADAATAAAYYAEALAIDPASAAAREGLARAYDALGQPSRARRVRASTPGA